MQSYVKVFYLGCVVVGCLILLITVLQYKVSDSNSLDLIPNIVHYILFNQQEINFVHYLSILSAFQIQRPLYILIHCNLRLTGHYWDKILNATKSTKKSVSLLTVQTHPPTHVYGQALSSIHHASDVARIHILREYGGIYLDNDVFILNTLDKLRQYNTVVGWPDGQYVGSQLLMSKPESKFLEKWLLGYKKYKPRDWYFNAGVYPSEILTKYPNLAHREPLLFGVHYLLHKLLSNETWNDWKHYYGIHVLYRHNDIMRTLNETSIMELDTNFGDICRHILKNI